MNGTATATIGSTPTGKRGWKTRCRWAISDPVACWIPLPNQPHAIRPLNTKTGKLSIAEVEDRREHEDEDRELSELTDDGPGPAEQREAVHRSDLPVGEVRDDVDEVACVGPGGPALGARAVPTGAPSSTVLIQGLSAALPESPSRCDERSSWRAARARGCAPTRWSSRSR